MSLFSSSASYLGVDFVSSSVKVAELANISGRPRLITYGFSEKNINELSTSGVIGDVKQTAKILVEICSKAKTTSKKVITALPNFSVFSSVITLPAMSKKELNSAVSWEAKKIIPTPLEEIILDWKIIEEISATTGVGGEASLANSNQHNRVLGKISSRPQKKLKILLTGASRSLIKKYVEIFNQAGLLVLGLETESLALIRSLVGNDKAIIMIVDLGATTSSLTIVDKGVPVLMRSIEIGGLAISKAISSSLNINLDRAEQFKQDLSLDAETAENSLPQTVVKSLAPILNEIKYTLNFYQSGNNKKVEKIILTGGTSLLGHLTGYLANNLNVNTYIGDPFSRTIFPTELKPVLDRVGSRFSVAVGLAMREIN